MAERKVLSKETIVIERDRNIVLEFIRYEGGLCTIKVVDAGDVILSMSTTKLSLYIETKRELLNEYLAFCTLGGSNA